MFTLLLLNGALVLDLCHLQLALLVFEYACVFRLQGCKVSGMHWLHLITLILKCYTIGLQFVNRLLFALQDILAIFLLLECTADLTMSWVLTSDSKTLDKALLTLLFAQASTSVTTCIHFLSSCINSLWRFWARLARYLFSDCIIFSLSECRATCPCASWHWVCWIERWCCEFDVPCN